MRNFIFNLIFILISVGCIQSTNNNIDRDSVSMINVPDTIVNLSDSNSAYEIPKLENDTFLTYIVDPKVQSLKMYWKGDNKLAFGSIQYLKSYIESKNQTLVFAMNGGMYMSDCRPLGLFIQDCKTLVPINNKSAANANFYAKPNGIFYIDTSNVAGICKTEDFIADKNIKYATQSGPMLLIDGEMHPICKPRSMSTTIRNGVGILPDNRIIFVMTVRDINFYDFANYFKKAGCKNALFLDGGISRMYLPEKNWTDLDGNFGVIIGVTTK
jgi:uncharacterized protein YigE (DUF2233 family)